jgi:hypothetical protein
MRFKPLSSEGERLIGVSFLWENFSFSLRELLFGFFKILNPLSFQREGIFHFTIKLKYIVPL